MLKAHLAMFSLPKQLPGQKEDKHRSQGEVMQVKHFGSCPYILSLVSSVLKSRKRTI